MTKTTNHEDFSIKKYAKITGKKHRYHRRKSCQEKTKEQLTYIKMSLEFIKKRLIKRAEDLMCQYTEFEVDQDEIEANEDQEFDNSKGGLYQFLKDFLFQNNPRRTNLEQFKIVCFCSSMADGTHGLKLKNCIIDLIDALFAHQKFLSLKSKYGQKHQIGAKRILKRKKYLMKLKLWKTEDELDLACSKIVFSDVEKFRKKQIQTNGLSRMYREQKLYFEFYCPHPEVVGKFRGWNQLSKQFECVMTPFAKGMETSF